MTTLLAVSFIYNATQTGTSFANTKFELTDKIVSIKLG